MQDRDLIESEAHEIGRRVREELARRRMSRQALADMARISLSTLEKSLAGTRPFTLATTLRIEESLGIALRPIVRPMTAARETAPEYMGAYARAAVSWIEGRYVTIRPSFGSSGAINAYLTTIRWLDAEGHLGFFESQRADVRFEQNGHVSMPNLSGHIYLVTNEQGQYRLATFARPTISGTLFGVLSTLQAGQGAQLIPVATPIAMFKIGATEENMLGLIMPGSPHHAAYREVLETATGDDFVRFHVLT